MKTIKISTWQRFVFNLAYKSMNKITKKICCDDELAIGDKIGCLKTDGNSMLASLILLLELKDATYVKNWLESESEDEKNYE